MLSFLIGLVVMLTVMNIVQFRQARQRSLELGYMRHKLSKLLQRETTEPLPLPREDLPMRELIQELNTVMQRYQQLREEGARVVSTLRMMDLPLKLSKVNVQQLCEQRLQRCKAILAAQGIAFEAELPRLPMYGYGNPEAVERIMDILIANAIVYGQTKGPIGMKLWHDEDQVWLDIWDYGPAHEERHGMAVARELASIIGSSITVTRLQKTKAMVTLHMPRWQAAPEKVQG